jgi:hypothetical protein
MQVWNGWTVAREAPTFKAPRWDEWLAQLQHVQQAGYHQQKDLPFSEREMARLTFLRWLYLTGRLDPKAA